MWSSGPWWLLLSKVWSESIDSAATSSIMTGSLLFCSIGSGSSHDAGALKTTGAPLRTFLATRPFCHCPPLEEAMKMQVARPKASTHSNAEAWVSTMLAFHVVFLTSPPPQKSTFKMESPHPHTHTLKRAVKNMIAYCGRTKPASTGGSNRSKWISP